VQRRKSLQRGYIFPSNPRKFCLVPIVTVNFFPFEPPAAARKSLIADTPHHSPASPLLLGDGELARAAEAQRNHHNTPPSPSRLLGIEGGSTRRTGTLHINSPPHLPIIPPPPPNMEHLLVKEIESQDIILVKRIYLKRT
jgi:hypothetical protein